MTKKILLIVGDYVEDYEAMVPFQMLELLGHQVHAVSPGRKQGQFVKTAIHDFLEGEQTYTELKGHNFVLNYDFDQVKETEYAGIVIPGGRAPEFLRSVPRVIEIVKHFVDSKKPIAAICHGPLVLTAIPGAVKGKKATAYTALKWDLENAGAIWDGDCKVHEAVVDENLVTGVAWPGHAAWIKKFADLLGTKIQP